MQPESADSRGPSYRHVKDADNQITNMCSNLIIIFIMIHIFIWDNDAPTLLVSIVYKVFVSLVSSLNCQFNLDFEKLFCAEEPNTLFDRSDPFQ